MNICQTLLQKGEFIWDKNQSGTLTSDNIHPNAAGHEQYGNYIISQLESRDILHENNTNLPRKFMFSTKNTRDIKFANATGLEMTGTWENGIAGQADNKYEAIQATAEGDTVSFTYESTGNDTLGVTLIGGTGTWILDEGTENEVTGELKDASNNLPIVKKFVEGLSAGTHTVKITNTNGLKLGRIIADGGLEVNAASTAPNGDHIPASMPENRIIGCQVPNFHRDTNDTQISYSEYTGDYTSNDKYTVRKITALSDLTAGGSWGCHGIYIERATAELNKGILYDNYTATAGTYVFKAKVRAIAGNPTVGATTVKSYVPTYDDVYGKSGFAPSTEWEDYKATLSPKDDGFSVQFGILNATSSDVLGFDVGDGVYYAPEVAYDINVAIAGGKKTLANGTTNTVKAEIVNQIGIKAKTADQSFTWSIVDENGDEVDGITITPIENSNEATVVVAEDAELGTYYVKAVSASLGWQKTLPVEVEVNTDPYAKDHVPGAIPENITCENQIAGTSGAYWQSTNIPDAMKVGSIGTATRLFMTSDRLDKPADNYYASGLFVADKIKTENPENTTESSRRFVPELNKNYVFGVKARSVKGNVRIGIAHVYGYGSNYSAGDHGKAGVQIGTDWTDFKTTVAVNKIEKNFLMFGIVTGEAEDYVVVDPKTFYLAEEVPHSIALDGVDGTSLMAGNDATFESKIFNQLGLIGYLDQNAVTFTVGDNLGNEVEGLTVTSDGNIATVSASIDVPAGEYYVRANYAIDEDTTWRKTIAVTVTENTDPYARDHVPGEIPENRYIAEKGEVWTSSRIMGDNVSGEGTHWINDFGWSANRIYTTADIESVKSYYGMSGVYVNTAAVVSTGAPVTNVPVEEYKAGDHYVFSFAARNANPEIPVQLRVGAWNGTYSGGTKDYIPVQEYPNGIVDLPQTGEWVTINTTLAERENPIDGVAPSIRMGFPVGTPKDAAIELNICVPDVSRTYYAKEVPHSLTLNGVDGTEIVTDSNATFESKILNQLGLPGYLDQNAVTFTVGDNLGNAIDGITVTSEGNIATVSVADGVAAGEYYLRANYAVDENTTWRKTLAFTVKESIANTSDFVQPAKPANLTTGGSAAGSNITTWSGSGIPEEMMEGSNWAIKMAMGQDRLIGYNETYYADGIFLKDTATGDKLKLKANTDYVFSIKAKSVEGNVRIGLANVEYYNKFVMGNHGEEGIQVGTDWTEIKTTLSTVDNTAYQYNYVMFGIVTGAASDYFIYHVPSLYMAEEVAYEFDIDASAENVEQGKSIELDATLLNQLDEEGALSQDFTWVAITDDRTEYLDGFTFAANAEDASKTTLTVAEDVQPGEYLIVAQNAEEGVSKHYRLTVTEPAEEPEVPVEFAVTDVEIADGTVTVSFEGIPEGGKNVVLYVAKYLGNVFNGAEVKPITLTGENATESKPESFTKAEGETVKAFIWNPDMTALLETPATN